MFLKGHREEINNATTQKLQQKTLNWTLNNLGEVNGNGDGWRPQDTRPYFHAFQDRKPWYRPEYLCGHLHQWLLSLDLRKTWSKLRIKWEIQHSTFYHIQMMHYKVENIS